MAASVDSPRPAPERVLARAPIRFQQPQLRDTGVRTAFVPHLVGAHGRERTSIETDPGPRLPPTPTDAELIADIQATDARWLPDVECRPTC
jgi:hypothetical protein